MENVRTIFTGGKKYGPRGVYFGNTGSITVAADHAAECSDNYFKAALSRHAQGSTPIGGGQSIPSAVSLHAADGRRLWYFDAETGRITGRRCWLDCKAAARPSWAVK